MENSTLTNWRRELKRGNEMCVIGKMFDSRFGIKQRILVEKRNRSNYTVVVLEGRSPGMRGLITTTNLAQFYELVNF